MNIYMKIGKRNGKRKKKRNSELIGLGGFWPSERERARARVGRRPTRPASGERRGDGAMGVGPRARGRGADGVER
jgi:hypothetical protein